MESSMFKPSSMDLIRAGLQDLDKARTLFDQLKTDDIPDERCAELLSALAHACDPDMALSNFVDIVNAMQSSQRDLEHVIPDNDALKRLVTVLGVSDAMGKFMRFKPQLVEAAAVDNCNSHLFNHAQRRARLLKAVGADPDEPAMPVASKDLAEAATALRSSYRNQLAAIIAQDAVADDPTSIQPTISRELSDLADAALEGALAIARHETEGSEHVRFTIIGMGKLGAQELNYVSDVDLIYVVEPADKDVDHQTLIRVGTKMGTMLQRVCQSAIMGVAEQPLWQIDGGLRPEGKDGALVRVLPSHKNYYEQWAENWEFQALLKARPVAGDPDLGQAYMDMTRPFVWSASKRKNFVYDCQKMRKRVEDLIPAPLKDREIKLGRGGLRDVEFTVQMLQLVHGRTDESLRTSNTLDSLQRLSEGGYVSRKQAVRMSQDYRFERVMEHRQQIWSLKRTHLFPDLGRASVGGLEKKRDIDVDELNQNQELRRLARAFGLHPEELVDKYDDTRREVRHLHLDIYYRPMLPVNAQMENDQIVLSVEAAQERFESIGFGDPDAAIRHVQALTAGVGRAAKINRIILPAVLQWLGEGQNPDMGLLNWRKLEENFGTESGYLLSNSRFLGDALNKSVESISWLGDDDNLQARTREALDVQTGSALERFGSNINEFATSMRAMRRHEIERIGLSWMSGVISDSDSLKAMTDVYDAIIDASLTWAVRHQIAEFGVETAPAGITVIAMGRYGGREVNFSSDADAILIYRPADDADDGQANAFAKKVVEDLRNILQGPTTLEPKIELDLDLRPEGKNGPLVRSYASCEEYYESWASTWERQALLRARYAAGDAELARDFLINIADPLRYPTTELTEAELQNIRKLKARMEAERLPRGVRRERHLKLGKGGLSDVEWTVQLMQLQHAGDIKDLRVNGTLEALDVLEAKKLISAIDAIQLRKAWTLCTAARNGSYLWSGRANQADILPDDIYSLGGIAVYLGYGAHRGQHFENDLLAVMRKCRDVCQRLFYGKTEGEAAAATTATASAATQQPQTAPRPRMHVIAPRLERNRHRAQR